MRPDGRLTRQGRLIRTFAFFACLVAGVVIGSQAFAEGPLPPTPTDTYTIQSGDSLWGIAHDLVEPGQSTIQVVDEIVALNDMDGVSIRTGDQILVPLAP